MSQATALERIAEAKEKSWKKLDLSGLDLTELPAELWDLTQLKVLILGWKHPRTKKNLGNNLTYLPSEIGQLTNLVALYAANNTINLK